MFLRRKLESYTKMEASSECPPCPSSPPPPISSPKRVEGRPFKCDLCAASFVSKHGLKYHMESIHKTVPPGSTILHPHPSGIQNLASSNFPCGQCTHSFSSGRTLKHREHTLNTGSKIPKISTVRHLTSLTYIYPIRDLCADVWISTMISSQHPDDRETAMYYNLISRCWYCFIIIYIVLLTC